MIVRRRTTACSTAREHVMRAPKWRCCECPHCAWECACPESKSSAAELPNAKTRCPSCAHPFVGAPYDDFGCVECPKCKAVFEPSDSGFHTL